VPVTARLSGKFYERFGDEIANELVEWFNAVDSTYQGQLKEINDLNWARMEARFDAFDSRMTAFEMRMEARMSAFETRIESRMDVFESRMEAQFQKFRSEMLLWMFAFWTATVIPLIGVMLALSGVFRR
jgi:urate oxidase